jgi:hypothetical protein
MRSARLLVVAALVLGATACGGPDGVEPKQWARQVCTALTPWRAEITDLTSKAQQQLGAARTPAETKTNIVDLLAGAEASSEKARAGVSGAGVPAVDDGPKVAEQFTSSLTKARDAYGNAKRTVSGLATDSEKTFYGDISKAFTTLKNEYERSAIDPSHVGPTDLQEAFDEVPECR